MGAIALLLICISSFLVGSCGDLGEFLPNGNFELSPHPSKLNKTIIVGQLSLPNWTIQGLVEYVGTGPTSGGMYIMVPHGTHAVRLGNEATISQKITNLKPGKLYSLTFSSTRTCAQDEVIRVSVPPDSGDIPLQTTYNGYGADTYAWGFYAKNSTVQVMFHNTGIQEDSACGPLLDAVAIKELKPPMPARDNLVKNGGFEEGPYIFKNATSGILLPPKQQDQTSPLPGWIIESLKAVRFLDNLHFSIPFGQSAVELVAGRESAITQVLRTIPNKSYKLTFVVGDAKNDCHGDMMVQVFASNVTKKVAFHSKGKGEYKSASLKFKVMGIRTRITFFADYYHIKASDSGSLCGPVLDEVKVVPISS